MRRPRLVAALMMGAVALFAAACSDSSSTSAGGEVPDGPTITIGAQDFGESAILAEVYGQALADAGYPVEQQALGGFRDVVYTSFESGDINFTASDFLFLICFLIFLARQNLNMMALNSMTAGAFNPSSALLFTRISSDPRSAPVTGSARSICRLPGSAPLKANATAGRSRRSRVLPRKVKPS